MRQFLKVFRLVAKYALATVGALVLNRVVSMLDAMRIYRKTSSKSFGQRLQFAPEFGEDGGGLLVNVKF